MVRVLEFGAQKYASHNWKKGLPITQICESLIRHLTAYMDGEDLDPESGLSHIGHIMCNTMFLSYMSNNRPDLDDRYKKESRNDKDTNLNPGQISIDFNGSMGVKDFGLDGSFISQLRAISSVDDESAGKLLKNLIKQLDEKDKC